MAAGIVAIAGCLRQGDDDQPALDLAADPVRRLPGEVGMNDPSQSGPTYPFIAGMMN
jgi:hypothetical protein